MPYIKLPLNNIITVKRIVSVHYMELSADFVYSGESHDFWELMYVVSGQTVRRGGEREYPMGEGDVIFHKPGEFHSMRCDGIHPVTVLIISFDCHSAAMTLFGERLIHIPEELRPHLGQIMEEAMESFVIGETPLVPKIDAPIGSQQMLRCSLETFLIRLIRLIGGTAKSAPAFITTGTEPGDRLVNAVIEYLTEHLGESVTLTELSERLHYSKSRICHTFREKTGSSVKQYFIRAKLEEAKRLLDSEDLSVAEVSERLSFESPSHFSKAFRRVVGLPPSAYRSKSR